MIVVIAPPASRAEYLRFDLAQLRADDEAILVASSSRALRELALSTERRVILVADDSRKLPFGELAGRHLRIRARSSPAVAVFDRPLAAARWRLRRVGRILRHTRDRLWARTWYRRVFERALVAIREAEQPERIWVYDISFLPEVVRVFDGSAEISVR